MMMMMMRIAVKVQCETLLSLHKEPTIAFSGSVAAGQIHLNRMPAFSHVALL